MKAISARQYECLVMIRDRREVYTQDGDELQARNLIALRPLPGCFCGSCRYVTLTPAGATAIRCYEALHHGLPIG